MYLWSIFLIPIEAAEFTDEQKTLNAIWDIQNNQDYAHKPIKALVSAFDTISDNKSIESTLKEFNTYAGPRIWTW